MVDLIQMISQAREANRVRIEEIEKMIENNIDFEMFPQFLQPQAVLSALKYDKLEKLILSYQRHFHREIDTTEIKLELNEWEVLLRYCIDNNRPLEKISTKDIYRIKHSMDGCLEEGEFYDIPIKYQKNRLFRKIIHIYKKHIMR